MPPNAGITEVRYSTIAGMYKEIIYISFNADFDSKRAVVSERSAM